MAVYTFKVSRFRPGQDGKPRLKTYKVKLHGGATVLDGLIHIQENIDPALAFRRSCRSAICGSCAVRVNGKASLICDMQAKKAARKGVIVLEPLANFKVIRDLVVDLAPFWDAVEKSLPWLVPDPRKKPPKKGHKIVPGDDFIGLGKVDVCVLCAACHSDCPVLEEHRDWPGPVYNVKTARFILDARDFDAGRPARAVEAGLDLCAAPQSCPVDCPKEIDLHGSVFKVVRKAAGKRRR